MSEKRKNVPRSAVLLIGLAVSASLSCTDVGYADQGTAGSRVEAVEMILRAWKDREEEISSASFTWQIDRSHFDRWSTYQTEYWSSKDGPNEQGARSSDLQSLSIQGDKWRMEVSRWRRLDYQEFVGFSPDSTGPGAATRNAYLSAWKARFSQPSAERHEPYRCVTIYDGCERWDLHDGHTGHPVAVKSHGWANEEGEYPALNDVLARPLILACRPLLWIARDGSSGAVRIVKEGSAVQGTDCLVVDCPVNDRETMTMWIAASRGYHVLRLIHREEGEARYQLDIDYGHDSEGRWLPQHWTVVTMNDSRITPGRCDTIQFASCTVTDSSVNHSLSEELFRPQVPAGTYVVDVATGHKCQVAGDGRARELSSDEVALVRSALEIANPERESAPSFRWYQVVAACFLVLGVAAWCLHRRRAKPTSSDGTEPHPLDPGGPSTQV